MTKDDANIFRMALFTLEETSNEVITNYLEDHTVTDGGEELVALVARAIAVRYEEMVKGGEGEKLLLMWRHGTTVQ